MLRFVQEHTRLFTDRLKTVVCFEKTFSITMTGEQPIASDKTYIVSCRHYMSRYISERAIEYKSWLILILSICGMVRSWTINYRNFGRALAQDGIPVTHVLVPIESVEVTDLCTAGIQGIGNIAFAFHQSLTNLSVRDLFDTDPILLEYGWVELPALTHLGLSLDTGRLKLALYLFACYPNLKFLRLGDGTVQYRCHEIMPSLPIAHLNYIKHLHLDGWTVLLFDPSTLLSTTKLDYLSFSAHV
ncbi:hypothetical protein BGZ47_001097 [Haplosporangium gracile]|nr:hypothetical protein BGZ47_001097 [Haplosporangium gracile]